MVPNVSERIKTWVTVFGLNIIQNRLFSNLQQGVQEGQTSACAAHWRWEYVAIKLLSWGEDDTFPCSLQPFCLGLPATNKGLEPSSSHLSSQALLSGIEDNGRLLSSSTCAWCWGAWARRSPSLLQQGGQKPSMPIPEVTLIKVAREG